MRRQYVLAQEIVTNFNLAIEQHRYFIAIKRFESRMEVNIDNIDLECRNGIKTAPEFFQCREQVIAKVAISS